VLSGSLDGQTWQPLWQVGGGLGPGDAVAQALDSTRPCAGLRLSVNGADVFRGVAEIAVYSQCPEPWPAHSQCGQQQQICSRRLDEATKTQPGAQTEGCWYRGFARRRAMLGALAVSGPRLGGIGIDRDFRHAAKHIGAVDRQAQPAHGRVESSAAQPHPGPNPPPTCHSGCQVWLVEEPESTPTSLASAGPESHARPALHPDRIRGTTVPDVNREVRSVNHSSPSWLRIPSVRRPAWVTPSLRRRALASEQVACLGLGADCPPADQGSDQEGGEAALRPPTRICDGRHAEAWGHCARTLPRRTS